MLLQLTVSCFSKIQMVFPYWYRLTRVVPDKGPLKPATDEPGNPAGQTGCRLWCPGNPARVSLDPYTANFPSKINCSAMHFRCPALEVGSCVAAPVQPGRAYYVVFLLNLLTCWLMTSLMTHRKMAEEIEFSYFKSCTPWYPITSPARSLFLLSTCLCYKARYC